MNHTNFFLARAVPYLITFVAGAGVFYYSVAVPSIWSAWLVEISGALSAIPIVFLIYDYFNYRLTVRANRAAAADISGKINSITVDIAKFFFTATGGRGAPGIRALQKMLDMPPATIARKLKLGVKDAPQLHELKNRLDAILYRAGNAAIFDGTRFEMAMNILRNLSHITNTLEYGGDRRALVKYTAGLFDAADDWLDSDTVRATKTMVQTTLPDDTDPK